MSGQIHVRPSLDGKFGAETMLNRLSTVSVRSAIIAAAAFIGSETMLFAQNQPPAGQGSQQGGGGRGQGAGGGGRGGMGGGRGGMGGMGGFGGMGGGRGAMGGMGGMGRGMQDVREALEADFQRRDVTLFVRQLKLTEDQSGVLETLFVDYEAQYQPEAEAITTAMTEIGKKMMSTFMTPERQQQMQDTWGQMQKEMQEAEAANGPMDDDTRRAFFRERMQKASEKFAQEVQNSGIDAEVKAAMGEMLTKLEGWQTRKSALRDNFTQGLKVVLDDEQLAGWPAFERFLVREKTLPRGRISGENVNLFFLVDELRLPQDQFAKLEPLFNDYETRLDSSLRARNSYIEQSMPKLFKSIQTSDVDGAKLIFKRQAELRSAVRDVNDEFRKSMVIALGESTWAKSLDKAVLENGWDRIYRATTTDRMFEEAMKIQGLDPTVLQAVTDLYAQYGNEVAPMNERLKNLARTEEPDQIVADGERFVSMVGQGVSGMVRNMGGGPNGNQNRADDASRKAFDERNALGERYQERLKALLTPEQWDKLPKGRGQGGGRGGNGGPGGAGNIQGLLDRLPEEQRKQFMDAVDKNKNGKVDDDEQQAVRDYMRQQFGNMRGGGQGGAGGPGGQGGGAQGGGGRARGGRGGNGGGNGANGGGNGEV